MTLSRPVPLTLVALAGCGLLLARPLVWDVTDHPVPLLVVGFVVLGIVGWAWPAPTPAAAATPSPAPPAPDPGLTASTWTHPVVVFGIGVVAFAFGRLLANAGAPEPFVARVVGLNVLAAVAEEAFFRRFVYDALERHGVVIAVVGSALAFAVVHVTVWGGWVFPLDVAAGLLFGWQRWASRSWAVPAATHVVANLLVLL